MDALHVGATRRRLEESGGGYEVVHRSPGLEIGVYVLVALGARLGNGGGLGVL